MTVPPDPPLPDESGRGEGAATEPRERTGREGGPATTRRRRWCRIVVAGCAGLGLTAAAATGLIAWEALGPPSGAAAATAARFSDAATVAAAPARTALPSDAAESAAPAEPVAPLARVERLAEDQRAATLLLATLALESAAAGSAPFAGELAYAMRAAGPDPDLLAPLDRLMRWAEFGVPSRTELTARFPRVAAEGRAAARASRPSFADRATLLMRDVALRFGIGERPTRDPDAALDRAGASLAAGRLDAALAELGPVPPAVGTAVQGWAHDAAARAEADSALRDLRRIVLARIVR